MDDIERYKEKVFDDIKHVDELGNEYWKARELMVALGYSKWENFHGVVKRAMIACRISRNVVLDDFPAVRKIVESGATTKEIIDYKLSRYACYLIVQNANPRKKIVALGQTYFAIQTRKMEINEEDYSRLTEDEKRLYTRINVKNKNKYLFDTAKKSGVINYAKFNDFGYKGLYNGEGTKQIAKRKGIKHEKEDILDYMGSTELAANLFRITQTDDVLKNKKINTEMAACMTHHNVGRAVRHAIKKIGGTMPEELPTPNKSIQQLEKEELQKLQNN